MALPSRALLLAAVLALGCCCQTIANEPVWRRWSWTPWLRLRTASTSDAALIASTPEPSREPKFDPEIALGLHSVIDPGGDDGPVRHVMSRKTNEAADIVLQSDNPGRTGPDSEQEAAADDQPDCQSEAVADPIVSESGVDLKQDCCDIDECDDMTRIDSDLESMLSDLFSRMSASDGPSTESDSNNDDHQAGDESMLPQIETDGPVWLGREADFEQELEPIEGLDGETASEGYETAVESDCRSVYDHTVDMIEIDSSSPSSSTIDQDILHTDYSHTTNTGSTYH